MESGSHVALSPNPRSNVFLMVRFRDSEHHEKISRVIGEVLGEYSLRLIRADFKHYHDELWGNVQHCMDHCEYGIAVFEQINEQATSPNVSLELGYMLAKGKRCLLLKEKGVPQLQADLVGHLCRVFDADRIEETVGAEVRNWLRDLGIAKKSGERLLVYVSSGGTCRDPMAKAITLKLLEQHPPGYRLRVEAVALHEPSKATASESARRAIREMYGEDLLADHRAAKLTPTLMEEADLILVMHRDMLKTLPSAKARVLKPFFGLEGNVADPWPDEADEAASRRYTGCAAELRTVLEPNINRLIDALRPAPRADSP
ncbi:MAG TPA: hypothetical protein VK421_08475 [Pyrinomonadaceae bacterium]|nr:hypothetical protein [Pyrinomonadaceae bacterium]